MSRVAGSGAERVGGVLALGFGTTVAMWTAGYAARTAGMPNWALFFALLAVMACGAAVCARVGPFALRGRVWVGLLVGALNLLILGSVLSRDESRALMATAAWAVPGWFALCAALVVTCATLADRVLPRAAAVAAAARPEATPIGTGVSYAPLSPAASPWAARLALVTVAATALLLVAGGIVTGLEVGMAVPDWPGTFGYNMFLYPLAHMTGGVYFEHSHRLLGSLVGLTTLTLAAYVVWTDRRGVVRIAAVLLLAAVIAQGVLGGRRVVDNSPTLAAFHGVLAQAFFAGLLLLHAALSPRWRQAPTLPDRAGGLERSFGFIVTGLLLLQIILGARLRHLHVDFNLHLLLGVLSGLAAAVYGLRAWLAHENHPPLAALGGWLTVLIVAQVLLGAGAFLVVGDNSIPQEPTPIAVAVTTAHQSMGAVVLAIAATLTLWHRRITLSEANVARAELGPPVHP
ncbi:MAG: COX15/CtaA family protein [Phycisphaerales bacterium]|nr:COX15/CtaA family protein [Phycisphaerales bacterium]